MTRPEVIADQTQRIVDALEPHREGLEEIAATDTPFASRAQAALDWLEEHREDSSND
jgi:hypothetical protein